MIGLGLVTMWLETHHVGARGSDWNISFPARCLIAGRAIWFYIGKLLWPVNLCFVYPRWHLDTGSLAQWLYPVIALAALVGLGLARNRIGRGPVTAAFFYVGTLFPVLGFLNAYYMSFSFVCDHLAYLSSLGLIALGAATAVRVAEKLHTPALFRAAAVVMLLALAILTWRQSRMYVDDETLWRTTLVRNPDSFLACNNLGHILLERGQVDAAIPCFKRALEIKPDSHEACVNLGSAFRQTGRTDEAIKTFLAGLESVPSSHYLHYDLGNVLLETGRAGEAAAQFRKALEIKPDFAEAHNNLGNALKQSGQTDEAMVHFRKALEIDPLFAGAWFNLGTALLQSGQADEAIVSFQRSVEIDPNSADACNNLGLALLQKGRVAEAIGEFQRTLQIQPNHAEAYTGLGIAFLRQGRPGEAVVHFQKALEIQPDNARVQQRLAWVLATTPDVTLRNGARAVELAEHANQLSGGNDPAMLGTLAAAYAEAGRFPDAVATARRAQQLAADRNNPGLVDALQTQIGFYRVDTPFREAGPTNVPPR
jgi:tetratricopeptide (TPR) repeat protein